ncbi:GNAT family N-acetyltransferase [Pseudonocardia sp. HH130630-07]|uniref:GNAT family N-acetyltransferase n=1 Tax=Pseudonocardia sp. HH130630-07 TaxID=1690815 RepID=UPI0018D4D612|nr:GNAT family N-acetyltransferase [Pseudonocardia sp. HH130630-07]
MDEPRRGLTVRDLDDPELQRQAVDLYRRVFGAPDRTGLELNTRLLSAVLRNGGTALGVVDGDSLVGLAVGFCGMSGGRVYHYSQTAAVAPELRGRGVGRLIKLAQADAARAAGATRMRWSFDPASARNAHFNLDVLGATGRWYVDDFYHRPGTDRVVVDWDLERTGPPPAAPPAPPVQDPAVGAWSAGPHTGVLVVPTADEVTEHDRMRIRAGFRALLGRGLLARSCRRISDDRAVYTFAGDLP